MCGGTLSGVPPPVSTARPTGGTTTSDLITLALGTLLLYLGGEALVRSAIRLSSQWGVKPMVIGLTIVAFGTSAPELFASLLAALRGTTDLTIGNVIGSNTANIGLILGVTALISPIRTHAMFIRREVPFMLGVAVVLLALVLTGNIGRLAGASLLGLTALYLVVLLHGGEAPDVEQEFNREYGEERRAPSLLPWLGLGAGLLLLSGGAHLLVNGASGIARSLGIAELTIGLTMVAVGTSLPELFTSVVAALRQEPDIALGNVVGSNILNVLFVLGASALARPLPIAAGSGVIWDVAVMLGFSLLLIPFLLTGLRLARREAALLLAAYAGYVVYLFAT
ncbi:MAG: calcium/sodium antiporter [Trueperaceae bacterium]